MTEGAGQGEETEVSEAGAGGLPVWAWWAIGGAVLLLAFAVWFAAANATPAENEPVAEPTEVESPTPMPSPTDVPSESPEPEPSESPTPMPSPTDVPSETPDPEPSDSPTPMPSPTDIPGPPTSFGEGKIVVGEDAAAGTYRTAGTATSGCAWLLKPASADRLRGLVEDVVVGGIPTVTLSDGDTFTSKGCGTFSAVDPAGLFQNASADVSAAPGVWLVGEDIGAGTWKTADLGAENDPTKLCKWTVTESLDNNYATVVTRDVIFSGAGTVVLQRGQQFESTHCGEWTLLTK